MQKATLTNQKQKNKLPKVQSTPLQPFDQQSTFEIMIVHYDKDDSVEVIEGDFIDFGIVMQHLGKGNSVFLTSKNKESQKTCKKLVSNNYISHV